MASLIVTIALVLVRRPAASTSSMTSLASASSLGR